MRFYLDCMLVRGWTGKATDDYGGAEDHALPFGSTTLVYTFELVIENC